MQCKPHWPYMPLQGRPQDGHLLPHPLRDAPWVTHMILKANPAQEKPTFNLKYMNSKIKGASKAAYRPKRVKHCLIREDSSDEEEAHPKKHPKS